MLWKVHVHFQRPSASMDLPAKMTIIIKNVLVIEPPVVQWLEVILFFIIFLSCNLLILIIGLYQCLPSGLR